MCDILIVQLLSVQTPCRRSFFKGSHFQLLSNTTDSVVLELKRVFSENSNSLTTGERWERFNFAVRHPDQQMKIVRRLEEICQTGTLDLSFIQVDKDHMPKAQFSNAIVKLIRGIP